MIMWSYKSPSMVEIRPSKKYLKITYYSLQNSENDTLAANRLDTHNNLSQSFNLIILKILRILRIK